MAACGNKKEPWLEAPGGDRDISIEADTVDITGVGIDSAGKVHSQSHSTRRIRHLYRVGRRIAQGSPGTNADNAVHNQIGVHTLLLEGAGIQIAGDKTSSGCCESARTGIVTGRSDTDSPHRQSSVRQVGSCEQGVTPVVAGTHKEDNVRAHQSATTFSNPSHAFDGYCTCSTLHERAIGDSLHKSVLGLTNNLDRVEPAHHSTVTDFARFRG
jgi:hypothetical protein